MSQQRPTNHFDDELLSAYLDNELSPEERTLVEDYLATHPAAQQLLAELQTLSNEIQSLPAAGLAADLWAEASSTNTPDTNHPSAQPPQAPAAVSLGSNFAAEVLLRAKAEILQQTTLQTADRPDLLSKDASPKETISLDTTSPTVATGGNGFTQLVSRLPFGHSVRGWGFAGTAIAASLVIMALEGRFNNTLQNLAKNSDSSANQPEDSEHSGRSGSREITISAAPDAEAGDSKKEVLETILTFSGEKNDSHNAAPEIKKILPSASQNNREKTGGGLAHSRTNTSPNTIDSRRHQGRASLPPEQLKPAIGFGKNSPLKKQAKSTLAQQSPLELSELKDRDDLEKKNLNAPLLGATRTEDTKAQATKSLQIQAAPFELLEGDAKLSFSEDVADLNQTDQNHHAPVLDASISDALEIENVERLDPNAPIGVNVIVNTTNISSKKIVARLFLNNGIQLVSATPSPVKKGLKEDSKQEQTASDANVKPNGKPVVEVYEVLAPLDNVYQVLLEIQNDTTNFGSLEVLQQNQITHNQASEKDALASSALSKKQQRLLAQNEYWDRTVNEAFKGKTANAPLQQAASKPQQLFYNQQYSQELTQFNRNSDPPLLAKVKNSSKTLAQKNDLRSDAIASAKKNNKKRLPKLFGFACRVEEVDNNLTNIQQRFAGSLASNLALSEIHAQRALQQKNAPITTPTDDDGHGTLPQQIDGLGLITQQQQGFELNRYYQRNYKRQSEKSAQLLGKNYLFQQSLQNIPQDSPSRSLSLGHAENMNTLKKQSSDENQHPGLNAAAENAAEDGSAVRGGAGLSRFSRDRNAGEKLKNKTLQQTALEKPLRMTFFFNHSPAQVTPAASESESPIKPQASNEK